MPEEVNQLHQDLEGVDEHRPNLQQEVGGLDVQNLFKLIHKEHEQVKNRRKVKTIKVMNILYFF